MVLPQLTRGAISSAMTNSDVVTNPIIQILGFKKIAGQGGADRYRLHISDGEFSHSFAMLATQLNDMVVENKVENFAVVRVPKMVCNTMNNKKIIIILELEILTPGREVGTKIGNPVPWGETPHNPAPVQIAAPPSPLAPPPGRQNQVNGGNFYGSNSRANSNGGAGAGQARNSPASQKPNLSAQELSSSIIPIRDINPYANKVTIRARVVNKTDIKTWSNSRGEGKLFSMELLDDSGEIRMTGFNQSVEAFYDGLEMNHVYYISRFAVKPANKNFCSLPHDYELSFSNDTLVVPCTEDSSDIPNVTFNFVTIGDIENVSPDQTVDVIGVCKSFGDVQSITARSTGKELKKRELILIDKTCKEINLTLWGKSAEDFSDTSQPVIAVKGAKVSDYNGRSLSLLMSSTMQINPDISEAHALRGWYDDEGANVQTQSLSTARVAGGGTAPFKLMAEANAVSQNDMEKGDYFMAKVTLMAIKRDTAVYKACVTDKCNKKVNDLGNGMFRCEKCNKEMSSFKHRLMLQCNFADFSDNIWATAFEEPSQVIMDGTSETLGKMFDEKPDEFDAVVQQTVFTPFIIKFRSRMETYNNENRKKFTVLELNKINHAEYSKQLLADIRENS